MTEVGQLEERIVVRNLRPEDLEAVTALDAKIVGRRRDEYFKSKLQQNLVETGIKVSLAAEVDEAFCGFLLARVHYGEFGRMEPVAVLDTFGVHPDFRQQGVGSALLRQLRLNLRALGVDRLATEVRWADQSLLAFFQREGFTPAPRFCLDLSLEERPADPSDDVP
jgi:ribosomal protein S18 acetylase RimI-like enzyme